MTLTEYEWHLWLEENDLEAYQLTEDGKAIMGALCEAGACDDVAIVTPKHSDKKPNEVACHVPGPNMIKCNGIPHSALIAHELTHVRQFEEWGWLTYYLRALQTHGLERLLLGRNVYTWSPGLNWSAYGMEQQADIVRACFSHDAVACKIWSK